MTETAATGPAGGDDPNDRFRLLVESVVDYGIFMLDTEGRVCSWNSGAQAISGYRREDVLGWHFSLFYLPDAAAAGWPEEELRRARALGRFEDEGWRVRQDGSRFWANVVITALKDASGQLTGYGKVTRDLTERRRQEQALSESEQRFRLLVESVRDYSIFMLDPAGVIESWNGGAEQIKGYRAAEVIGRHFSIFYTDDDRQAGRPQALLAKALAQGRVEDEGWRVRKDGTAFWSNVVISPIYDGEQRLRGYAKVTRDMTERRQREELERSSRRMNEFLAMLAHELRNPLAPMRSAVTILQMEAGASSVVRGSREVLDRQLTHLTRLVDDLLDVGRLSTGKVRLRKERLQYNQLLVRAVEASRPAIEARRHRLRTVLPPHEIFVEADDTRITQVLQNLLLNAAKYTPEGGDVTVTVRLQGTQLVTEVEDNGIGLTPQAIDRIFDLFTQGDGTAESQAGGLGIGLTVARSLIEMHGGVLRAESPGPGQGSRFVFFLPNAQAGAALALNGEDPADLRVLVVDDNRDAADTMAEVLRLLGCAVRTAYDGPQALALAAEFLPQLVLLDLDMPGMSGYEVARTLRSRAGDQQPLAAAVTGYGAPEDRRRTHEAGFDAHLAKPVDPAQLQRLIARARERARPAADASAG